MSIAATPKTATPSTAGLLKAFQAPGVLDDPDEAQYMVRDVRALLSQRFAATLKKLAREMKPFKSEGEGSKSNSWDLSDDGDYSVSYHVEVTFPEKVYLGFSVKLNLAKRWEELSHERDFSEVKKWPELEGAVLKDVAGLAESVLGDFEVEYLSKEDESKIEDWLDTTNRIDVDVTTTTIDEDGNEEEANESYTPDIRWSYRSEKPVVKADLQGTVLGLKYILPVTIHVRDMYSPEDHQYQKYAATHKESSVSKVAARYEASAVGLYNTQIRNQDLYREARIQWVQTAEDVLKFIRRRLPEKKFQLSTDTGFPGLTHTISEDVTGGISVNLVMMGDHPQQLRYNVMLRWWKKSSPVGEIRTRMGEPAPTFDDIMMMLHPLIERTRTP